MVYNPLETDRILLGSGKIYAGKIDNYETVTEEEIVAGLKELGNIESGCTISYKPSYVDVRGGEGNNLLKVFLTKEEVSLNTGVCEWIINNLSIMAPATVTSTSGKKTVKIGNQNNGRLPINYIRFIHTKKDGTGQIIVNIAKAQSVSGFNFNFENEKPLTIGYEFRALNQNDGTLVEIIETFTDETMILTSISVVPNEVTLSSGESKRLSIIGVYGNDPNNTEVNPENTTFTSDNDLVATVDQTGTVTFVGTGSAVITATNGTLTDTCKVTCA